MTEEELRNLSEEELQQLYMEQYNAEMKQIRVEDMVMQTIITLINLGGRRAGLAPETEDERDPAQLALAINAARALLPLVEGQLGPDGAQIQQALAQLQMAFVQSQGGEPEATGSEAAPPPPSAPNSGLWVPGQ
jgi:hypothetical protein